MSGLRRNQLDSCELVAKLLCEQVLEMRPAGCEQAAGFGLSHLQRSGGLALVLSLNTHRTEEMQFISCTRARHIEEPVQFLIFLFAALIADPFVRRATFGALGADGCDEEFTCTAVFARPFHPVNQWPVRSSDDAFERWHNDDVESQALGFVNRHQLNAGTVRGCRRGLREEAAQILDQSLRSGFAAIRCEGRDELKECLDILIGIFVDTMLTSEADPCALDPRREAIGHAVELAGESLPDSELHRCCHPLRAACAIFA